MTDLSGDQIHALRNLARKQAGEDVDWISISAARALTDLGYAERTAGGWIISQLGSTTLSATDHALRQTPSVHRLNPKT
jgi:hypothetical protein